MVYIILRTGKKIKYNNGNAITVEQETITIRDRADGYLIARVPMDIVERAEFSPPCRIDWENIKKPRKSKKN